VRTTAFLVRRTIYHEFRRIFDFPKVTRLHEIGLRPIVVLFMGLSLYSCQEQRDRLVGCSETPLRFSEHMIEANIAETRTIQAADLDRDGDMDTVMALGKMLGDARGQSAPTDETETNQIVWCENDGRPAAVDIAAANFISGKQRLLRPRDLWPCQEKFADSPLTVRVKSPVEGAAGSCGRSARSEEDGDPGDLLRRTTKPTAANVRRPKGYAPLPANGTEGAAPCSWNDQALLHRPPARNAARVTFDTGC